ncbi:MAG: hypothetical protein ABFE01_02945 [Phycisphaerales bacterium]|jgi:hypothetical protein
MNETELIIRNVQAGMCFGAFMAGAIAGLMPLIAALVRKHQIYAFFSWLTTAATGFIAANWLGVGALYIALPVAFFLMVLVLCCDRGMSQTTEMHAFRHTQQERTLDIQRP